MFEAAQLLTFMFHELRIGISFAQDKNVRLLLPLPYGINCRKQSAVIGRIYAKTIEANVSPSGTLGIKSPADE